MAQGYVVQRRDTLARIARRFYGDAGLSEPLARYNGVRDPDLIVVGQVLEIPSRRELNGSPLAANGAPEPASLARPNGLDEILTTFGDIYQYIGEDGTLNPGWEAQFLTQTKLPFAIPLAWDKSKRVSRLQCHSKLRDIFPAAFSEIQKRGLESRITTYGGCFNFRGKRTSGKLSTHSWGIAIDLNTETNAQGTAGTMDPEVVAVFRDAGFKWGGEWTGKTKDPMHFQFCTGY